MKAVRFHEHGAAEVLRYEDAPDPKPQDGWATVRVRACALNHLDLWQRRGIDRVRIPLPHISGSDVAGEVVDPGGSAIAAGTRVLLYPGLSCGVCAACAEERQNLCAAFDVLGLLSDGGYAELVTVPAANLMPIPAHVDFVTAAAFPLTFLTAWHMLVTLARVKHGDTVLVLAGGSGVGQAAIPIARLHGARVFATSSPAKMEKTRALGAEVVFDHYADDFSRHVRAATGGLGADIVVEHVGEATWDRSVRALARGGRLVTCGATTGYAASIDLRHLFARQLSLIGSYMGTRDELRAATEHFFAGRLTPSVDTVFPLEDAAAAQQRLESKQHFGKIVLEVGSG
ncbi:MAG TPA: zinc-binding dehydrogenase [Vicinamibacterales bacterium]|nr:zinc-binding dehydrogenase [Vicinamibacterales bacterium]